MRKISFKKIISMGFILLGFCEFELLAQVIPPIQSPEMLME